MTIRKLKALFWLLGVAGFLGAGYTFYDIWDGKQQARFEPRSPEFYHQLIRRDLAGVEDSGSRKVYYSPERYKALWTARIDGSWPAPKVVAGPAVDDGKPTAPVLESLNAVLEVSAILWSTEPLDRFVALRYLKDKTAAGPRDKVRTLHVSEGSTLRAPYDAPPYNARLIAIGQQTITFQWGEEQIEITPGLGRDGKDRPQSEFLVAQAEDPTAGFDETPDETVQIAPGSFLIGRKDKQELKSDALKILRDDLNMRTIPPVQEGGRSSIELKHVEEGSLPSRYGFRSGDRIISVNGVPMVSEAAALNWYKSNSELPSYHVVYDSKGVEKSTTIHVK